MTPWYLVSKERKAVLLGLPRKVSYKTIIIIKCVSESQRDASIVGGSFPASHPLRLPSIPLSNLIAKWYHVETVTLATPVGAYTNQRLDLPES